MSNASHSTIFFSTVVHVLLSLKQWPDIFSGGARNLSLGGPNKKKWDE